MDWFKGKSTGNYGFSHWIWVFPVNFPLNQSIDMWFSMEKKWAKKTIGTLPKDERTDWNPPELLRWLGFLYVWRVALNHGEIGLPISRFLKCLELWKPPQVVLVRNPMVWEHMSTIISHREYVILAQHVVKQKPFVKHKGPRIPTFQQPRFCD